MKFWTIFAIATLLVLFGCKKEETETDAVETGTVETGSLDTDVQVDTDVPTP